jgi:molybdopterin-guanine dinucleotide biosynthesis protein A
VAKRDTELPSGLAETLVLEPDEPRHPLCGALAALEHAAQVAPGAAVVLVGCDMPFLTGALLGWLAAALEPAIVLEVEDRAQPLPARCSATHAPLLRDGLAREAPLREVFGSLAPAVVDERALAHFGDPRRLCFSVNSAGDLATAERWLAPNDGVAGV